MPFNARNEWVPEEDSVSGRVTELTSQDSPMMRQASGLGARQANRRGLVNSSISAGASRASTLAAAVPIASQEAGQIAAKNQMRISGDYDMGRTKLSLDAQERDSAAARMTDAFGNYSNNIASINSNSKMKAGDRAAQQASAREALMAQLNAFKNLYPGANLNWGP